MTNNTTRGITSSCLLVTLLSHPNNAKVSIGISVLIGAEFITATFTIVANIIVLWTIVRTRSLQTPSNTLLAALCSSYLMAGLATHPIFITTLLYLQLLQEPSSKQILVLKWSGTVSSGVSLFTVLYITLDRYAAVCFPFIYERQATVKNYAILVTLTWGLQVLIAMLFNNFYVMYEINSTVIIIGFGVMFYCYIRIYMVIAQKERASLSLGTIGDSHREEIYRNREERQKSHTIMILLTVFTASYLPPLVVTITVYKKYNGGKLCNLPPSMSVIFLWSSFFLNLSSMCNPIVYCIFIKPIRKAAWKIFCKHGNMVVPF